MTDQKLQNAFNPRTLGGATCPSRARAGPGPGRPWPGPGRPGPKMGNVNFSHFSIFGVKNKMSFFEAKYVIWKHLDSSVLKISQKSRPKPPVGGKQVRPTPFLLKNGGGVRAGPGPARARAKNGKCQFFTFSDFWGQK